MKLFDEIFNSRSLYLDYFDKMPETFYVFDTEKRLIYLNSAAEQLDGYSLEKAKGRYHWELYDIPLEESPILYTLATERPVADKHVVYYTHGKEIIKSCSSSPIYENGVLVGAYCFQRDLSNIRTIVEKNLALQKEINLHRANDEKAGDSFSEIIGGSVKLRHCVEVARRAGKTNSSVMLVGNTGSGKEVFAHAIHNSGKRRTKPFLAINCAAIPETLLESILFGSEKGAFTGAVSKDGILVQANGGTVFLDEINSMPLSSQAKLLRVVEERKVTRIGGSREIPVDIRLISSINESPVEAIQNKHIRDDLFYRLSVVQLQLPSLKERKEDILPLVNHFIQKYNEEFGKKIVGIDSEVADYFLHFDWPGNVRQLRTCVESAMNFVSGNVICFRDLPGYIFENTELGENGNKVKILLEDKGNLRKSVIPGISRPESEMAASQTNLSSEIEAAKKEELIVAIKRAGGNAAAAARDLGISRQLIYYRMKKYHIK